MKKKTVLLFCNTNNSISVHMVMKDNVLVEKGKLPRIQQLLIQLIILTKAASLSKQCTLPI